MHVVINAVIIKQVNATAVTTVTACPLVLFQTFVLFLTAVIM